MSKNKLNLGKFVTKQREKLGGISQSELAKRCNLPLGTIASIESGYAKSPRTITLKKLAEGLSVSVEVIYKLASDPETKAPLNYEDIKVFRIKYLGTIPTTKNIKQIENINIQLSFPFEFVNKGDFILTIGDNKLYEEDIYSGDYVIIVKQETLQRSGDLMLYLLDNIITLRRVYKNTEGFRIEDKVYPKDKISFLGKAIQSINKRDL